MKKNHRALILLFLLFLAAMTAGPARAVSPAAPVDWRFGIVETYEAPGEAGAAGAAWTRVRFQWADVQAGGPGSWTPRVSDAQISGEAAAGRRVVGLLIGLPGWARAENGIPRGLYLPHTDPGNTWAAFVRTAAGRYSGVINNWVIWNEPDVWDKNAPGHTWDGSVEDFAQLIKVAYLTIKETNPNAQVHMSAFTYFWDANYGREQYFARLLDALIQDPNAAANNYYFDVATAHLYFQPAVMYDIIQAFYGMMNGRGIVKPIWVVETNAPPADDPTWPVPNWTFWVTQQEQAAFIPQAFALSLAAGAQRIAIYKMKDLESDIGANPEPFGLLRRDGSRRPAFDAYRVAVRYMAGTEASRRVQWDEAAHIKLAQGKQSTHVLFSRVPGERVIRVEATAPTAVLADMAGGQRTISAQGGFFTITLPAAPCGQSAGNYCMIGGRVFYLVQSTEGGAPQPPAAGGGSLPAATNVATAAATRTPAPAATATPSPSPTPSATPSGTATATPSATTSPTSTMTATVTPSPSPTAAATRTPPPTGTPTPAPLLSARRVTAAATSDAAAVGMIVVGLGLFGAVFLRARRRS